MQGTGDRLDAWRAGLLPHHLKMIRDSAISDEVGAARGYRSIENRTELLAMGFSDEQARVPCLYVPAHSPGGMICPFIRPDDPRYRDDGKVVKYDRPGGSRNLLDVCPGTPEDWLTDPNLPLIITEGSRKVDAGVTAGWPVVGLLGVWGWLTEVNGGKFPLADFREVMIPARQLYIAFDSDAITKNEVYQAEIELANLLRSRQGIVRFMVIPEGPGGEKQGLDDYLAAGGKIPDLIADAVPEAPTPRTFKRLEDKADFLYYLPDDRYYHRKTKLWCTGLALNKVVERVVAQGHAKGQDPDEWVAEHQPVNEVGWFPGKPAIIEGLRHTDQGWVEQEGWRVLNQYEPSTIVPGRPEDADRFVEHLRMVYPTDWEHILSWLAFKVQRPDVKVNHALLLGGGQGIGKDTIIDSVIPAIGVDNVHDVGPSDFNRSFNPFAKGVLLRVSELRDLGDRNRNNFYEHMKTYVAAPPHTIFVSEKYRSEYPIPNVVGVIYTTNNRTGGLWIPEDDRRHYIAWSELKQEDIPPGYFKDYYAWLYGGGGQEAVAGLLLAHDLSGFDPGEKPRQTAHMRNMVDASQSSEFDEFWTVLEQLEWPAAVTIQDLVVQANRGLTRVEEMTSGESDFAYWLKDRRNKRQLPYRMEEAGYVKVLNPKATTGKWKSRGAAITIYVKTALSEEGKVAAAEAKLEQLAREEAGGVAVVAGT